MWLLRLRQMEMEFDNNSGGPGGAAGARRLGNE